MTAPALVCALARSANSRLSAEDHRDIRFVSDANDYGLTESDLKERSGVACAGKSSELGVETIAVSVVSTWEAAGEAEVFNLAVSGAAEYFAEGILVHNCDEIAKFQYPQDVWDNLELGLRLGDNPQALVTTTPRPIPVIREMIADPMTVVTTVSTYTNLANLAPAFIRRILSKYEGTRLGEQELHAKILNDIQGALWTFALIENNRVTPSELPSLARVVVGVDPATSSQDKSNETGIVVCGKSAAYRDQHNRFYPDKAFCLRDFSGTYSPTDWATAAIRAYHEFSASRIVAESNQGGEMVRTTIHTVNANIPVTLVPAIRSKGARAEPVAGLMEQGRVKHLGNFPVLEDQMTLTDREDYQGGGSPDRMDAYVHAITDLMLLGGGSSNPDDYDDFRAA